MGNSLIKQTVNRCSILDCEREYLARGFCNLHYLRARESGDLAAAIRVNIPHKLSSHPLYHTWENIRQRCNNPNHTAYKWYGARGIRMCERWNNFRDFVADVGDRPEGTTLDRFPDNNGNYEPGNVRWATQTEQIRNSGLNKLNKTGTKGVWYSKKIKNYQVAIHANGRQHYLGSFYSLSEAIAVRLKAEKEMW